MMAEPARDTSSIMGKRSEQLSGRKRYPIFPIFCLCVFAKNSSNRYGLTTSSAANKEIIISAKRRVYRCLNRGQSGHRESDYEIDEVQCNRCD